MSFFTALADIDLNALETEIRRLVAEDPEFVYRNVRDGHCCNYTRYDESRKLVGDCIIGQALINIGVDPEELLAHEGGAAEEVLPDDPRGVRHWAGRVQSAQDSWDTWQGALAYADRIQARG